VVLLRRKRQHHYYYAGDAEEAKLSGSHDNIATSPQSQRKSKDFNKIALQLREDQREVYRETARFLVENTSVRCLKVDLFQIFFTDGQKINYALLYHTVTNN
jgi:hypothetical protein